MLKVNWILSVEIFQHHINAGCLASLNCSFGGSMLISWFDASEAQEFGKYIAEMYSVTHSIIAQKKEKASTVDKRVKLLGKLTLDVRQFGQTHRLNIYKKAKLGNVFKWTLLDKGYDTVFVDALTKEVILALK
jgi:hypothetical protein